ncbi:MAG TPA: cation-transporting P-type ATPase [Actinoplanes sp.]|nr:cation-transporting P-type ATPase [Actinoplanes sp.]
MARPTAAATLTGLSTEQAQRRLTRDGPNTVAAVPPQRLVARIAGQFADPLVALLLVAAVVTTLLGDLPDTFVILLVVTVNTIIGVVQQVRADRAIAALDRLAAPTARVVRDGVDRLIPTADVVRDDLVRLEAGDIVPADLTLDDAYRVQVDESALTGESVAVHRDAGDELFAGTVLVTGRAAGRVVRTGAASALGRITALVTATRPGPTPLQRRLAGLGRVLGATAVALSAVVFALGLLAGRPLVAMAVTAVSLVVAAVPESLPAVVTLALALGARRMAGAQAIPRRLHAVETLGSVTVIASDKTGTLTEGRMSVHEVVTADGTAYAVSGAGYAPEGDVRRTGDAAEPGDLSELAQAGLLCNDADLAAPTAQHPHWSAVGDPMEAALLTFAQRCGLDHRTERDAHPRVAEHPFDQASRRMTTVHRRPDGRWLVVRKGAPEAVLDARRDAVLLAAAAGLAAKGLRVLAVAAGTADAAPDPAGLDADFGAGSGPTLAPVGLFGIGDPLRASAPDTAAKFAEGGVRLILITGDHPATAAAIGTRVGITRPQDRVVCGDDGSPGAHDVEHGRVFARIQPEQKLDIIAALQQQGQVVAMTGDGVNDAPALRRADIGIAMGGGTEVARQSAELVLVDDNLATVAVAIGEGRRIYDNIRRFLRYALSGGAAEIIVMLLGPFLGLAVPLLPGQILWINLLTHGLPGVALGAEPADAEIMRRGPRSPQESVLGDGLLRSVLVAGGCISVVVLGAGVAAAQWGRPWQSVVFVVLGLAQLGVALAVRARPAPGQPVNWWLPAAVLLSAVLQVTAVLFAPLQALLGTEALTALDLLGCATVSALPALVLYVMRLRSPSADRRAPAVHRHAG